MQKLTQNIFFICTITFLLTSCVGKKKHLELLQNVRNTYEARMTVLKQKVDSADALITQKNLQLAERKGENNALVQMQDKLQGQIDRLEKEMENLNLNATDQEKSMNEALQQKKKELKEKEALLAEIQTIFKTWESASGQIAKELQDSLTQFPPEQVKIKTLSGKAILTLPGAIMFRSGNTSRVRTGGMTILTKVSQVLLRHPAVSIQVVGHTDNRKVKGFKDNWEFSAKRAATVAGVLTKDFDISTSQVAAIGKGEFAPAASNETKEGRAANERIELVVQVPETNLVRDIRRKL